jgi:hypothetical protein
MLSGTSVRFIGIEHIRTLYTIQMNKHIFLDNLTATIAALATGKNKFFARSVESPSFEELVKGIQIKTPSINSEGTFKTEAVTPVGNLDSAFKVEQWLGNNFPTLIYHHGNNEKPFNYGNLAKNTFYKTIVLQKESFKANLIVVRAPFHDCSLKYYQKQMAYLSNFMAMIAVSVKMNECIIQKLREKSNAPVITAGISLGGWVTNLHRAICNTSTVYAPLMAGSMLGELFIRSKYHRLSSPLALKNSGILREKLNFNNLFSSINTPNIFPLLAKYDQYIEFEVQKESYNGFPLKVVDNGHVTGALNVSALRSHILDVIQIAQSN